MDDDAWLKSVARDHPLHAAVAGDQTEAVQELLAADAEVDSLDEEGWTPLMWALSGEIASMLLAAGADAQHETEWGESVLMATSRRADPATVAVILDSGVDPNAADDTGNVALGEAASAGNVANARFLIRRGANVNAETLSGETPIWAAARAGHVEMVEMLLDEGARPGSRARVGRWEGRTAADMADAEGHHEIASLLRRPTPRSTGA